MSEQSSKARYATCAVYPSGNAVINEFLTEDAAWVSAEDKAKQNDGKVMVMKILGIAQRQVTVTRDVWPTE